MQIDFELAKLIATAAMTEPYRQIQVLNTRDFVKYLNDRGISLQWETIHKLWKLGVLHPIAILEPAITPDLDKDRFRVLDFQFEKPSYVDLGLEVPNKIEWPKSKLDSQLSDCLFWHPYQLWLFEWLSRVLEIPIGLDESLYGPEAYSELAFKLVTAVPEYLIKNANDVNHFKYLRILALLLLAEPILHISIYNSIKLYSLQEESLEKYFIWKGNQTPSDFLSKVGLTLEEAKQWHHAIAAKAHLVDPINNFRILLRHAKREKLEKFEGQPLLGLGLYDAAEVLRRYLEQFHAQELLEEDDVIYGQQGPDVKQRFYGATRTADFKRTIFRRIVRDFDLDPQARSTWFIEGDTEEAYIKQIAQHLHIDLDHAGIEIMNLNGLGGLNSKHLMEILERFQHEEVFPYISIDYDAKKEPIRLLRAYAERGLLPIGFKVWNPDFEANNFSNDELVKIANKMLSEADLQADITLEELEPEMTKNRKPVGKTIEKLWNKRHFYGQKGTIWGKVLANWSSNNPCPTGIADSKGNRPINTLLFFLLRGQTSDYWGTTQNETIDKNGNIIPRKM